ncbi:hypothetical protein Tco_0010832 [Tanacetum coccineum]
MKGTKPLDQPLSRSGGSNRPARANGPIRDNRLVGVNESARVNGSAGVNGSTRVNRSAGQNESAGVNGSAGQNESENGSAGTNGSVGSVASTSTGVGELNEVGESSGGQAVKPRWVNDKSRDHMEKYQAVMVESHGEDVESQFSKVRIRQISQENRQKRANTGSRNGRVQKKPGIQSQSQKVKTLSQLLVNLVNTGRQKSKVTNPVL